MSLVDPGPKAAPLPRFDRVTPNYAEVPSYAQQYNEYWQLQKLNKILGIDGLW
jgi:hypothetical protein